MAVQKPDPLPRTKEDDIQHTTYEGRRYAAAGHYWIPNDTPELRRLNEQHAILKAVKNDKIHLAPFLPSLHSPAKILDIGCGSGIWCLEIASLYGDEVDVIGMDLTTIQPEERPANVRWVVHDMEVEPWPFPEQHFDFIHVSLVHGCIADWEKMMARIVR
jgi:metalloendopeptidase OMA1, mitochondrial